MKPSDVIHYASGIPLKLACGRYATYTDQTTPDLACVTCDDCLKELEAQENGEQAEPPKD